MMSENIARNMYSSQGIINYPTQLHLVGHFHILEINNSEFYNENVLNVLFVEEAPIPRPGYSCLRH